MNNIEIERKFLIDPYKLPNNLPKPRCLDQFYINFHPSTRVRLYSSNNEEPMRCYLTIKGQGSIARQEFEYEVPIEDFEELLLLKQGNLITKHRYAIPIGSFIWEIDEFLGNLAGLWLAEIELYDINESFPKPEWLTQEVSEDKRYSNACMAQFGVPS